MAHCDAQAVPLRERLSAIEGDVSLPVAFYPLTLLMIFLVIFFPYLYRKSWVYLYDLVTDVHYDLKPSEPPAGCARIGKPGTRNLSLEFKPRRYFKGLDGKAGNEDQVPAKGKIEALFIHPIKSTIPLEVDSATVTPIGLAYDRLFCFAQQTTSIPEPGTDKVTSTWTFLTQRSHTRLGLVQTELWLPDPSSDDYDEDDGEWVKNGGCLVVRFPFIKDFTFSREGVRAWLGWQLARFRTKSIAAEPLVEFRLPICPTAERIKEKRYRLEKMKIWREEPEAWNLTSEIPEEILAKLKFHLGLSNPLTIFRVRDGVERELYKCAPGEDKIGYQAKIGFQDAYPVHFQNLSTIQDLESRVSKKSGYKPDSRRFRANLYISGPPAYIENDITRISIRPQGSSTKEASANEDVTFSVSSRTPRCTMPNNDPSKSTRSKTNEPLRTMKSYLVVDEGTDSPCLGMNAVPLASAIDKIIRVGDAVVFDGQGEHLYIKDPKMEARKEVW